MAAISSVSSDRYYRHTEKGEAAIKIQRAWRVHRKQTPRNGVLADWLSRYGRSFVAHATRNIEAVWPTGKLQPGECVLRDKGILEAERAFLDSRVYYTLPSVKTFREKHPDFRPTTSLMEFSVTTQTSAKSGKVRIDAKMDWNWPSIEEEAILTKNGISCTVINIFYDMLCEENLYKAFERVKKEIQRQYESAQTIYPDQVIEHPENTLIREHNLFYQFEDLRDTLFYSRVQCRIWVRTNAINWDYGDVVVLKGGSDIVKLAERSKYKTEVGGVGQDGISVAETTLPSPWENGGEFYCLSLDDKPSTIILGPREKIEKLWEQGYGNAYAYDELTPQERNFFHVPWHLEPNLSKIDSNPHTCSLSYEAYYQMERLISLNKKLTPSNAAELPSSSQSGK